MIGTKVMRIADGYHHEQAGVVIDETETRIRVMWKHNDGSDDKRTWIAKAAEGKRWTTVHGPAADGPDTWERDE